MGTVTWDDSLWGIEAQTEMDSGKTKCIFRKITSGRSRLGPITLDDGNEIRFGMDLMGNCSAGGRRSPDHEHVATLESSAVVDLCTAARWPLLDWPGSMYIGYCFKVQWRGMRGVTNGHRRTTSVRNRSRAMRMGFTGWDYSENME